LRRFFFWCAVALVAALLVAYAAWPRPLQVQTAQCVRGDIQVQITEEAETRLDREYVVSMPVTGRLLRNNLEEGQIVREGEELARIDTFERSEQLKTLQARIRETRALIVGVDKAKPKDEDIRSAAIRVQEARTRLELARKELERAGINLEQEDKQYKRSKNLLEKNAIAEALYDEAFRRYRIARADRDRAVLNVEAARKALERAKQQDQRIRKSVDDNEYLRSVYEAKIEQIRAAIAVLNDEIARCVIRSPATGPVLEEYQEDEQVLAAGTPLLKIGDLASMRIESDILSEEIGRVKVGQDVEIYGPAVNPAPAIGKIERIYPSGFEKISSLGIEQQRVKIIIAFDNSTLRLRPGVRVDIRIITERKRDVLLIPERALFKSQGRWHIFVVREGRAHLTRVQVGLRNDEVVEVLAPLREGDIVVLSPPVEVADGSRVLPEPER